MYLFSIAFPACLWGGSTHFASGDAASAERWLAEAEQRGLSPRVTTYTAVVDACAAQRKSRENMGRLAESHGFLTILDQN